MLNSRSCVPRTDGLLKDQPHKRSPTSVAHTIFPSIDFYVPQRGWSLRQEYARMTSATAVMMLRGEGKQHAGSRERGKMSA